MSAVRLAAVIIAVVAIAFVISPISPFTLGRNAPPGPESIGQDEIIDESKIAPANVTAADFDECNSINDDVQRIVTSIDNSTSKAAADLLTGEYCNRPALVHQISVAADPGVSLVAFACDASSGRIGDSALQDSLSEHSTVYCEAAGSAITAGADDLMLSVGGFRDDFVTNQTSVQSEDGSVVYSIEQVNAELDNITASGEQVRVLMSEHRYYDSATELEKASAAFDALLEKIENG